MSLKHNGELKLALRRIAEIRKDLDMQRDLKALAELADQVGVAYEACLGSVERQARIEEERMSRR